MVAKVDELMALCDRLEEQLIERKAQHAELARAALARFADDPTPANLEYLFHESFDIDPSDLRKSIFTMAMKGKLVEREAGEPWPYRKLMTLAKKIGSGATPRGGKNSYQESGVPLIRSMNVHFGGFRKRGLAHLSEEQAGALANVRVESGDVLLNITGASIGRVAIAPQDMSGARVNQHVCIVRTSSELEPQFLEIYLSSPVVQDFIWETQRGATRQALTKGKIERFEIPVPSSSQQKRIVAKVRALMALVDCLEEQQKNALSIGGRLLEAAVAELTLPQIVVA